MGHCEAEPLMLRFMSGDLDGDQHARYVRHLHECQACREITQAGLVWMDSLVFQLADGAPPDRVWGRIERQAGNGRASRRALWGIPLVAAAMGVGLLAGLAWHPSQGSPATDKSVVQVLHLGSVDRRISGQVLVSEATNRITITTAHLPPPPKGDVYEVWRISGRGPKALGTLGLKGGQGFLMAHTRLHAGDEIVICRETAAWKGQWMGPAILTAEVPGQARGRGQ